MSDPSDPLPLDEVPENPYAVPSTSPDQLRRTRPRKSRKALPLASLWARLGGALIAYVVMSIASGDPRRFWGTRVPRFATAAVTVLDAMLFAFVCCSSAISGSCGFVDG